MTITPKQKEARRRLLKQWIDEAQAMGFTRVQARRLTIRRWRHLTRPSRAMYYPANMIEAHHV